MPEPLNVSASDAAVCQTWPCHGPGCNRAWTRPSRSHDGRSCHTCRRSKAASDALRAADPVHAPTSPALVVRPFRLTGPTPA